MMAVDQAPVVDTVVVSAARLPTSVSDAAFSIVQIDPQALQTIQRVDEVLKTSPGVSLFRRVSSSGSNPTTQGVSVRDIAGSGAGRALVTMDGVPQNDPFGNWVIWTQLSPEALQGVSIVRGAGAGPYGAGALTGVIDLQEKSSVNGGFVGDVSGSDLGSRRASVAASDKIDGVQLFGAASAEQGDHWIPIRQGRGAADTDLTLEDWAASGKAIVDVGAAALTTHVGAYREQRASGLGQTASSARGLDGSVTLAVQPTAKDLGWKLQGWVRQSDLANSSASTAADRSSATLSDSQYSTPALGVGGNAAVRKAGDWGSLEAGVDVRADSGESRENYSYVNGAPTKNRVAGGDTLVAGVYAEGAWRMGDWLLTGGARADHYQSTDGHRVEKTIATGAVTLDPTILNRSGTLPTGRAALRRDFMGIYARAAAYAGFRAPSLNELYRPYRVGNNVIEANENLVPEKLYGGELALGRDQGRFTWSATGFVNTIKDPVINVTQGIGPATFPRAGVIPAGGLFQMRQNAGAINATGVEADAQYQVIAPLFLRASADYTDAHVDGESVAPQLTGKRPAETPQVTLTAGAHWTAAARVTLSADVRYESARFEDDQNTLTLRPATVLNTRLDLKLTKDWGVYFAVDNVTDAAIETDENTSFVKSYDEPRVFRIGVRFRE